MRIKLNHDCKAPSTKSGTQQIPNWMWSLVVIVSLKFSLLTAGVPSTKQIKIFSSNIWWAITEGKHSALLELVGWDRAWTSVCKNLHFSEPSRLSKLLCLEQLASQSSQVTAMHNLKVIKLGQERFSTKDKARTRSSRWGLPGSRIRPAGKSRRKNSGSLGVSLRMRLAGLTQLTFLCPIISYKQALTKGQPFISWACWMGGFRGRAESRGSAEQRPPASLLVADVPWEWQRSKWYQSWQLCPECSLSGYLTTTRVPPQRAKEEEKALEH